MQVAGKNINSQDFIEGFSEECRLEMLKVLISMIPGAFVSTYLAVSEDHPARYLLNEEEEHMVEIGDIVLALSEEPEDKEECTNISRLSQLGVSDIILARAE